MLFPCQILCHILHNIICTQHTNAVRFRPRPMQMVLKPWLGFTGDVRVPYMKGGTAQPMHSTQEALALHAGLPSYQYNVHST